MWENGTCWHSSMLAGCLWRPNSGCWHSQVVSGAFQQWWQQQWSTSTGADLYKRGIQLLFTAGEGAQLVVVTVLKSLFCSWEFALPNGVIVLFVPVVFSREPIQGITFGVAYLFSSPNCGLAHLLKELTLPLRQRETGVTGIWWGGSGEASLEHCSIYFQENFREQMDNPKTVFLFLFIGFQRADLLPFGCW